MAKTPVPVRVPQAGDTVPGGYVLGEQLGRGTIAAIHAASAPNGVEVAVKFLHRIDDESLKRFAREVTVMRSIPPNDHRVRYLGHGTSGGVPFLVMEKAEGVTLGQVLRAGRRFDEAAACSIMQQLCEAFAPMHKLGLTHCDIEPDNIVFSREQTGEAPVRVRLLDFDRVRDAQGLLKLMESERTVPGIGGIEALDLDLDVAAAEHIAPEQFWDVSRTSPGESQTDTPVDVFGLGVIFYQLLTAESPWPYRPDPNTDPVTSLRSYLRGRCATGYSLSRHEAIPPNLWSIIERALDRDPKRRQRDARELGEDIRRYQMLGVGVVGHGEDDGETIMAVLPGLEVSPLPPPPPLRRGPGPLASQPAPTTLAQALDSAFGDAAFEQAAGPARTAAEESTRDSEPGLAPLPEPEMPAPRQPRRVRHLLWVAGGFAAGLSLFLVLRHLI